MQMQMPTGSELARAASAGGHDPQRVLAAARLTALVDAEERDVL